MDGQYKFGLRNFGWDHISSVDQIYMSVNRPWTFVNLLQYRNQIICELYKADNIHILLYVCVVYYWINSWNAQIFFAQRINYHLGLIFLRRKYYLVYFRICLARRERLIVTSRNHFFPAQYYPADPSRIYLNSL